MNTAYGMDCPNCKEHNSFIGGNFGGGVNTTNYRCKCGFTAILVLTDFKRNDTYEIKAIPKT